jgi:hypothetical protein
MEQTLFSLYPREKLTRQREIEIDVSKKISLLARRTKFVVNINGLFLIIA